MSYAERAYFTSDACHHCAARDDAELARSRAKRHARLVRELGERRSGSRVLR